MLGVTIGVAVMLVSLAVVLGFKHEVSEKVIGFGSHIQVISLTQNQNYEMMPVLTNDTLIRKVKKVRGTEHIQRFATKMGILKTEENFRGRWKYDGSGIVIKSNDTLINWKLFYAQDGTLMCQDMENEDDPVVLKPGGSFGG